MAGKKWGKGQARQEKANRNVFFKADDFAKVRTEVARMRLITVSTLAERYKIRAGVIRKLLRQLEAEGVIVPVVRSSRQLIFTSASK